MEIRYYSFLLSTCCPLWILVVGLSLGLQVGQSSLAYSSTITRLISSFFSIRNFTLNFVWAQGLIFAKPINDAIDRMRYQTGGRNVEGQTYNVIAENGIAVYRNLTSVDDSAIGNNTKSFATSESQSAEQYSVPEVQAAPSYNLVSGIETSTSNIGITFANAFMT